MTKKQKIQKYEKLLKEFTDGHSRLKRIKMEMVKLRVEIKSMPNLTEERPDEIELKQ